MRLLITGSRTWTKAGPIKILLQGFKAHYPDLHIILGDEPNGVDAIAQAACKALSIAHTVHTAHWNVHESCRCFNLNDTCKAAGPRRNQVMVNDNPTVAYAFRSNGESRGTDDCIRRCLCAKIPTYTVQENEAFP